MKSTEKKGNKKNRICLISFKFSLNFSIFVFTWFDDRMTNGKKTNLELEIETLFPRCVAEPKRRILYAKLTMNVFFAALKCSELYVFKCSRCFNALFNGQCQIFRLVFRSPLEYKGATTLHCFTVETAFWCAMCCEVNQIRLSTSRIHDYEKIVTPAFPVGKCAVKWRTYFLHTHTYYEKSAAHSCFNTLPKIKWHIFFLFSDMIQWNGTIFKCLLFHLDGYFCS